MEQQRPVSVLKKKKMNGFIKALIIIGVILLILSTFFMRDLFIRAGFMEYDKKDIINFQGKYIAMLTNIKDEALKQYNSGKEYKITAHRKGLFEKSEIISSVEIPETLADQVNSVCHSYCYQIEVTTDSDGNKLVIFSCSQNEVKCILFSDTGKLSEDFNENTEELGEGWFYAGAGDNMFKNILGIK